MAKDVVSQKFSTDGGSLIVKNSQDIAPILEDNKRHQADGVNMKAGMRHVGQIPIIIWDQWKKEFMKLHGVNIDHADQNTRKKFIFAKLNDKSNAFLRTWQGKL